VISGTPLEEVAMILPGMLAERLNGLKEGEALQVEELRLRRGYPMSVKLGGGELPLGGAVVAESDLRSVLETASRASAHTVLEHVKQGFVTLRGGHRIGLCGTVNRQDGEVRSLRYISSLCIRVARAVEGKTNGLAAQLLEQGGFQNTLILGPPGSGKTTLLRELIRVLSDGHGVPPFRVGVADERGEIAAMWLGQPQFRVGRRTDVLDGCPKSEGLLMLLRGMNPQILAVDEITHPDDVTAMMEVAGCGAGLLATAHGTGVSDLRCRPVYRTMMEEGIFRRVIVLSNRNGRRLTRVEVLT
jgi:stage III sporulation protein AA